MAVITLTYLCEDIKTYYNAKWKILVEEKFVSAMALKEDKVVSFHQISFFNKVQGTDIEQIVTHFKEAGGIHLEFVYFVKDSTLIPGNIYDANRKEQYINIQYGQNQSTVVKGDLHYGLGGYTVSRIDENLYRSMITGGSNSEVSNWYQHMINYALQFKNYEDVVFVSLFDRTFTITVNKQQKFKFINSFTYQKPEEVCYKLVQVYKTFDLSVEECPVMIMGVINADSLLYNELSKYFKTIHLINKDKFPKTVEHSLKVNDCQLFPLLITTL
jgi:hypothetical protein